MRSKSPWGKYRFRFHTEHDVFAYVAQRLIQQAEVLESRAAQLRAKVESWNGDRQAIVDLEAGAIPTPDLIIRAARAFAKHPELRDSFGTGSVLSLTVLESNSEGGVS